MFNVGRGPGGKRRTANDLERLRIRLPETRLRIGGEKKKKSVGSPIFYLFEPVPFSPTTETGPRLLLSKYHLS